MFTRWKELSLIQKMNSILLSAGHATERVFNVSQLTLLSCALFQPYWGFDEHYPLFLIECCTQYDYECGIHPESTKHTHACTTQLRCQSNLDVALRNTWLTNHKHKLFSGIHDCNEEDNDEE
ncbi:unnamed protein product [Porites evermanni]|uniref:Uncharacterized protein n=1 Tax=Porites evermanni TaxID=104178 RepID=A0ABN8LJQ7_9CNID|nr:unnamed protein product [Porites evermanni]CAH3015870.1 unnamed protein product [Porites evermanni]